jgi:hypothetical protein
LSDQTVVGDLTTKVRAPSRTRSRDIMDIRHASRLLARRWPLSVPLLLLTAVAAALTASNVRPDYVARAHVSLLPPTVFRAPAPGQTVRVNPWDTERLSYAVIVRLNTKSFAHQVETEGFQGVWEAGLDQNHRSVIRIEVTSSTETQARATIARLLREVADEVTRQQAAYPDLAPEDKITTTRLDSGEDVAPSTGNVTRAVMLVCLAGLLLTAAAAAGIDARLRRRARRSPDVEATQPLVRIKVPRQMPRTGAPPKAEALNPDDSTIVLPLSNAPWAQPPERETIP